MSLGVCCTAFFDFYHYYFVVIDIGDKEILVRFKLLFPEISVYSSKYGKNIFSITEVRAMTWVDINFFSQSNLPAFRKNFWILHLLSNSEGKEDVYLRKCLFLTIPSITATRFRFLALTVCDFSFVIFCPLPYFMSTILNFMLYLLI